MKKLLLLLFFITTINVFAQNTYVPDDNFEQALIDLGYDSGPLDDSVLTANINSITFLDISDKGIKDLTGIGAMSSLEILRCNNNSLTDVDLSANINLLGLVISLNPLNDLNLSSNEALESLVCAGNELTSLNLSSNEKLKTLSCSTNNLTELNLSANPLLEEVRCAGNTIGQLDLSKQNSLTRLSCENNNLFSLNVRNTNNLFLTLTAQNNPNLLCIEVDDDIFNFQNVDPQAHFSVDCSGLVYAYVPDDNFEQALIDMGYDSGQRNNYVEMTETGLDQLTTLDISNLNIADLTGIEFFTSLAELNCRGNQLISLELSQNTALSNLICDTNQITSLDLSSNTALQYLDCSLNQLTTLNLNENVNLQGLVCIGSELENLSIKNGNNTSITTFISTNNPNLSCIEVDDAAFSNINWTDIDPQTTFSIDCSATGTYTDIPDPNFEQELIDLNLDSVLDGRVLTESIDTLTVLHVNDRDIASLEGIRDFVALTELRCDNNNLDILDVSQNAALIFLNATDNQLTSLDVSQNTALSGLACDRNQLTSLDLSQNTALTMLRCEDNQLTSLDVQQNLGLTTLYCNSNLLTSLNVSQNSALTTLVCSSNQLTNLDLNPALIGLDCKNNQLNSLDLSQNTAFTAVDCSSNQLTSLNVKNGNNSNFTGFFATNNPNLTCIEVDDAIDFSANWSNNIDPTTTFSEDCSVTVALTYVPDDNFEQALIDLGYDTGALNDSVPTASIDTITNLNVFNKNITDLTGIQDFVALTNLDCGNNQLTSLNVDQNTALRFLSCRSNQLTNLVVDQNAALTNLSIGSNQLTTLDLNNNASLVLLDCSNNIIASLDLSANTALTNLYATDNEMVELNLKNGNNTNVDEVIIQSNPNLTCVQVDNAAYATANWTDIDPATIFSEDCSTLNISSFDIENVITVYPNPASHIVHIKTPNNSVVDIIEIINFTGKRIQTTSSAAPIDVSKLASGIYLLKIVIDNQTVIKKLAINQ